MRSLTSLRRWATWGFDNVLATVAPGPARADDDAAKAFVGVLAGIASIALLADAFDNDNHYRYRRHRPYYRPRVVVRPHIYAHPRRILRPRGYHPVVVPRPRIVHRHVYRPRLSRAERLRRIELRREIRRRAIRTHPRVVPRDRIRRVHRNPTRRTIIRRTTRERVVRERRNNPRDTFMGR